MNIKKMKKYITIFFIMTALGVILFAINFFMDQSRIKLEKESVRFYLIERNAYNEFLLKYSSLGIEDYSILKKDLEEPSTKTSLSFRKVYDLYFDAFNFDEIVNIQMRKIDRLLKKESVTQYDIDSLKELMFYKYCSTIFNEYWYMEPYLPISKSLSKLLIENSSVYKQLFNGSLDRNMLEKIKIGSKDNGIVLMNKELALEFLGCIVVGGMLAPDNPITVEGRNFIEVKKLLSKNANLELGFLFLE